MFFDNLADHSIHNFIFRLLVINVVDDRRTADSKGILGNSHTVLECEGNITDAVPHSVDFEELTVGGEALHLFLPQGVVAESDIAGG